MTDLRKAAQAVLDRWDSPHWEWIEKGPTAVLMADLRNALAHQCTITTATLACKKPVKQAEPVDAVLAEREACLNQIEIIVEAEREACAKVCDSLWTASDCAEAIRARGNECSLDQKT